MKATLIEIDYGAVPEPRWYASHPGLRLWANRDHGFSATPMWHVLRGQQIPGVDFSERLWVDLEHAWQVREGDVELRLIEIPNAAGQAS
jgi:hypothetical protein